MLQFSDEYQALVCQGYGARPHKPKPFSEGEHSLTCLKCLQSYPYPDSLKESVANMRKTLLEESQKKGGVINEQNPSGDASSENV